MNTPFAHQLAHPFLAAYALFLRWCIWEAESHLRACAEDGILEGTSLQAFRGQIEADRVRLAAVQARMHPIATTQRA